LLHERIASQQTPFEVGNAHLWSVQGQLSERASLYGMPNTGLRPNLFLVGSPGPYKGRGRHPLHEAKFKFQGPAPWKKPGDRFEMDDPDLGKFQVQLWKELHLRKVATCPMRVARLERLESKGTRSMPKVIWVAWIGEEPPEPRTGWQYYTCAAIR